MNTISDILTRITSYFRKLFKRKGEKVRFPHWNPIRKREPHVNWSPTEKYKPRQKRAFRIVTAKDRAKAVQSST